MHEPVRLVIWDLDETFWRGTLTEGGITYDQACHDLVIALARRGIMSSICSKNNLEDVKEILLAKGIWDYFIFPSINWSSKGPRIGAIVKATQLRPQSVIFIDDNPHNRNEAIELNPGLRAVDETAVISMLADPLFQGKADFELSRLRDYQLLEEKVRVQQNFEGDAATFLRKSNIQVEILYNLEDHIDRAVELINRTNQLNFTKRRLPTDAAAARQALLQELDGDFTRRAGLVSVKDRFGDYGIVGFWAIEGHGFRSARAFHFCFSCRTLGMGVEQYVYERLGRPHLDIVGDVVSALDFYPDWINHEATFAASEKGPLAEARVLLRGGCEMEVLAHFFEFESKSVRNEFLFAHGPHMYWLNHVANFRRVDATVQDDEEISKMGFDPASFASRINAEAEKHDLVVLNFSADGMVPVYRNRRTRSLFSTLIWGLNTYLTSETDENVDRVIRESGMPAEHAEGIRQSVTAIREGFDPVFLSDDDWEMLYHGVLSQVPAGSLVIMVLALETVMHKDGPVDNQGAMRINAIRRRVIANYPNVITIEMNSFVRTFDDLLQGSTQHFSRDVNHKLFQRVALEYEAWAKARHASEQPMLPEVLSTAQDC